MDAGQLMQNAQQQLNKEIRVGSSHHADELRRKNQELYDLNAIR